MAVFPAISGRQETLEVIIGVWQCMASASGIPKPSKKGTKVRAIAEAAIFVSSSIAFLPKKSITSKFVSLYAINTADRKPLNIPISSTLS